MDRNELEKRRLKGARLFSEAHSVAEVARSLGVSWSAVAKWKRAWSAKGAKGLRSADNQFRKPRLTEADLRRIAHAVRGEPKDAGFSNYKSWSLKSVALLIGKIAHYYHPVSRFTALKVLQRLGFHCPKKVYRQRKDAESVQPHWLPVGPARES